MSDRRQTLFADSTRATIAAIAGSTPGFFVPIAIAAWFGANSSTDAFFLALSVASLVANALGATTQQAAIPFLIDARRKRQDVSRFIGEISVALLALALIPIIFLNSSVMLYVRGGARWRPGDIHLIDQFLWAFVPYVTCSVLAGVYAGALNADHRYARVAMSPAIRSVTVLAGIFAAPLVGVYALVGGYVLGEGIRLAYLLGSLRTRVRVHAFAWPRAESLPEFTRTAVAQMLGSGVLAFLPLMDRMMASPLGPGNVSLLDYADRLWQVPVAFAMSGFMVTSLAHWSERHYHRGTVQGLSSDTGRAAAWLFAVFLAPAIVFLLFRGPFVRLVFTHNRFTSRELAILTNTLAAFVSGIPVYVAGLIYTRAFLVLKRSDWLFGISLVQLVVKLTLNLVLIPVYGLVGIAAATALTYAVSSMLLVAIFHFVLANDVAIVPPPSLPGGSGGGAPQLEA